MKPESWLVYYGLIEKAARAHSHIRAFAADDPQWHVIRLDLARYSSAPKEQVEAIEDEALALAPTYHAIHTAMLHSKQPQWSGSWAAYDDGIDKIVSRTADTEGQSFYARIYGDLAMLRFKGRLFERSLVKWPRMKQGFQDLTSRYPTDWNWNLYGAFACLAGDRPTLRDILGRLGERIEVDAWKEMVDHRTCAMSIEAERTAAEDAAHYAKPQPVPAEILEQNEVTKAAYEDFTAGRFAQLDARRGALLQSAETTSAGGSKLTYFHQGLMRLAYASAKARGPFEPDLEAIEDRLNEWMAEDPTSKTALVLRAELTLTRARLMLRDPRSGAARGGAGFGVLAKASAELDDARNRMPDDPHVWATTLELALEERGVDEEFYSLAEQALVAAPNHPDIKAAILKRHWLPRTFTKAGFDKSVEFIVAMSPPDRKLRAYAESYAWLASVNHGPNLIETTFIDWTRMKRGLDELISAYPTDWNLNAYANLACSAKDKPVAAALLDKIGDRIVERQWSTWRAPGACKAWLAHADRSENR